MGELLSHERAKYTDTEAVAAAKTVKLDDLATPDDNTDLDFSTSVHGLVPKGTDTGDFLKDDGTWAAPAGGGDVTAAAVMTDNTIIKGDGGSKGVQDSGITVSDAEALAGVTGMDFVLAADDQVHIDGRTNNRTISLGELRIDMTPAVDDIGSRAIYLDIDANSVNDILGVVCDYTATGLVAGNEEFAFEVNVITADATGGTLSSLHTAKSGIGTLEVQAVRASPGVIPLHHESGTFGDIEQAWEYESGPSWTDITAACNSSITDVEIFSAENDIVYIGDAATFDELNVTLATVASGGGIKPTFEFSAGGSSWTPFTPDDQTNKFRKTGIISWEIDELIGWSTDTVNETADKYWVRITRTAASLTTPPIEDRIQVVSSTEYGWDENGAITANSIAITTQAITDNAVLTVDQADAADDEFARFTASGLESLSVAEAITALLGAALPENVAIILDPALSADGKYSGITEAGTAGATLAFGDLVYLAVADSRWELAKADAIATSIHKIGICVLAAAGDGNATTILLIGKVRADTAFPALTVSAPVYISAGTAGDITSTIPAKSTGHVVRVIGQANTADELWFNPDNDWVVYA